MHKQQENVDIVIVGAGIVGLLLSLAVSYKKKSLKILLIDNINIDKDEEYALDLDKRSIALSYYSIEFLKALGLDTFLSEHIQPMQEIYISDKGHCAKMRLHSDEVGIPYLGGVIELSVLQSYLLAQVKKLDNVQYDFSVDVKNMHVYQDYIEVIIPNAVIKTKLLVGADGIHSMVKNRFSFDEVCFDYQQYALVTNVEVTKTESIAFERFTKEGLVALLPLNKNRYAVVWVGDIKNIKPLSLMNKDLFIHYLYQEFGDYISDLIDVGKMQLFPLHLHYVKNSIAHRTVLLGNSAQNLHPVAGQGFNLALRDIKRLTKVIDEYNDVQLGQYSMLAEYEDSRRNDKTEIIRITHYLVQLFSNSSRLCALGRNMGLISLSLMPQLRRRLIHLFCGKKYDIRF